MSFETPAGASAGRRTFSYEVDAETLGRLLKRGRVGREESGYFSLFCDEGQALGGDNSAPTPLMYFTAALSF